LAFANGSQPNLNSTNNWLEYQIIAVKFKLSWDFSPGGVFLWWLFFCHALPIVSFWRFTRWLHLSTNEVFIEMNRFLKNLFFVVFQNLATKTNRTVRC